MNDCKYIIISLFLCMNILSCSHISIIPKKDLIMVNTIVYRFEDRSIPPEYQVSFTKEIKENFSSCVVDSYGNEISSNNYQSTGNLINEIKNILMNANFDKCDDFESSGCTGGTSEKLLLLVGNTPLFNASVYHCGGKNYGTYCGDITKSLDEKLSAVKCNK